MPPHSIAPKKLFNNVNLGVLYTLISAVVILLGTSIAIQYAKGNYRFTQKGFAPETGHCAPEPAPGR